MKYFVHISDKLAGPRDDCPAVILDFGGDYDAADSALVACSRALNADVSLMEEQDGKAATVLPGDGVWPSRNPPFEDDPSSPPVVSRCRCGWSSAGSAEHQARYGLRWHAEAHGCREAQKMMREAESE